MKAVTYLLIAFLLSGCTSTVYLKTFTPTKEGECTVTTRVDHYSMGWDREGVLIDLDKKNDAQIKAKISVNKSNGSNTANALADALVETISKFK